MGAGSPPIGAPGDGILPGLSVKGVSPDTCMSIDYHSIPTFEDVADLLPVRGFPSVHADLVAAVLILL